MTSQRLLCAHDATSLVARFSEGEILPSEVLELCLKQIADFDPLMGIVNQLVSVEDLRVQAALSDDRWRNSATLSPFDGVPFGVKANIAVADLNCTAGIQAFRQHKADQDAGVVRVLRAAGMIPVGTLNMHEAALGETSNNPAYRRTMNPHDRTRIPGGSSGGSAAAIAAGMFPVTLGTDNLGSVRLPSALCGVIGFKPGFGHLPVDGVVPLSPRLDHVGIHARSLRDIATVMSLFGEPNQSASTSPQMFGWRLAEDLLFEDLVAQAFAKCISGLDVGGFVDWSDVDLSAVRRAGLLVCELDASATFGDAMFNNPEGFSDDLKRLTAWASAQSEAKVLRSETLLKETKSRLLNDLDGTVLLSPTTTHTAPYKDGPIPTTLADLTAPAAIAGVPSISVPLIGVPVDGMPVGVQITGKHAKDVFAAAELICPDVVPVAEACC